MSSKAQSEHIIFNEKVKVPVYPKERFSFLLSKIPKGIKEKIFYFYGDSFLCEAAAKEVIARLKKEKTITYECLHEEDIDETILIEKLLNISLFSSEKVIWLKNFFSFSYLNTEILKKTSCYIIITSKEDVSPDFLKKLAIVVDFTVKASKDEQEIWQKQVMFSILEKANKKITSDAQKLLLNRIGFNLFALKNYLEILINYVGEKEFIDETDVKLLVTPIKEEAAFEIGEKLVQGDIETALNFFKNLLEQGFHPLAILAMLTKELKSLIEAKILQKEEKIKFSPSFTYQDFLKITYPEIKQILIGFHPYALYHLLKRASRYTFKELCSIQKMLLKTETIFKNNLKAAPYHLEQLIIFWCRIAK